MREALAPFDEHHGVTVEDFVEAERGDLFGTVQAIKIDVIDPSFPVFVNQCECRAGDFIRVRATQTADDSLRERGFPRAQIAD